MSPTRFAFLLTAASIRNRPAWRRRREFAFSARSRRWTAIYYPWMYMARRHRSGDTIIGILLRAIGSLFEEWRRPPASVALVLSPQFVILPAR